MDPTPTGEVPVVVAAAPARPRRRTLRWALRIVLGLFALLVVYLGAVFVEVWWFGRHDQARPVDAIVVMGAAQYDGTPSPVLQARLDHTLDLYRRGLAPLVVVTGGKLPGDRFTEAATASRYLRDRGVPAEAILRDDEGRTSWQELQASAALLKARGLKKVLLVSDPYHQRRVVGMAEDLGLAAWSSPTRTSPEGFGHLAPHYVQETFGVAAAHVIGFRHLVWIDPG